MSVLKPCPFCGSADISLKRIGNAHTNSRRIIIKCRGCRVGRTDGALRYSFGWLEERAVKKWNTRHTTEESDLDIVEGNG